MEEILEQLQGGDTKERLGKIKRLQIFLDQSQKNLSKKEVINLVDASTILLKDNNFKVCQGTLHLLILVATMSGKYLKDHINQLVPAVVERLGDSKQVVRDASRRLLLVLMEISTPSCVANRAGSYAWTHKNWRVRKEFSRTIASALNLFSATDFPFQQVHLPAVNNLIEAQLHMALQLLEDSNNNVREATLICLEEMYRHGGQSVKNELQHNYLHHAQLKEIFSRFDTMEHGKQVVNDPLTTNGLSCSSQQNSCQALTYQHGIYRAPTLPNHHSNLEIKVAHFGRNQRQFSPHRQCTPKSRVTIPFDTHIGDGSEGHKKSLNPIKVFSERELTKEFEKIITLLKIDQDWSIRMTAMQKLESIVFGGAIEHPCFLKLFKHFVDPLSAQLLDRRSIIIKQACQLLKLLSKRIETSFKYFAEAFIPMLKNCHVTCILPQILECAKHDQNATLRARCCEYALLTLEKWGNSLELHRAPDLYQELIRCCCLDAVGKVRSSARACYRVYSRLWPDRARQVFSLLDPTIQKVLYDEEGTYIQYKSTPIQDEGDYQNHELEQSSRMLFHSGHILEEETSYEQSKNMASSIEFANSSNLPQKKLFNMFPKKNLQKMLQSSHLKAMEIMLKGVDNSKNIVYGPTYIECVNFVVGGSYREIHAPTSTKTMRVTIDSPSERDPPHPTSTPAICHHNLQQSNVQQYEHNNNVGLFATVQTFPYIETQKEDENKKDNILETDGVVSCASIEGITNGFQGAKEALSPTNMSCKNNFLGKIIQNKEAKQTPTLEGHVEKLKISNSSSNIETLSQSMNSKHTSSKRSLDNNSLEGNHQYGGLNLQGEMLSSMDGVMSLNDILSKGLGIHVDWYARVVAFTYIQRLLQQGSKGLHEVTQNFEQIMKLFLDNLDNPHWKVTQAALSSLIELVPTCRRMFESYLERILPYIFARLVDNKDTIRQLGVSALEIIGDTYSIDTLLLPLLRSLDEQRIPKARIAIVEFAIFAFAKLAMDGSGTSSNSLLKLWLGKLAPLANDKNAKLKEVAIAGIIFVYSQFDPTIVLNFILGLSIEDQSMLRKALKQFTPHIDLDLMAYLQNKTQQPRIKPKLDQTNSTFDQIDDLTNRASTILSNDNLDIGDYTNLSISERNCKQTSNQIDKMPMHSLGHETPSLNNPKLFIPPQDSKVIEDGRENLNCKKTKELCNGVCTSHDSSIIQSFQAQFKDYHVSNGNFCNKVPNAFHLQSLQANMVGNLDSKRSNKMPLEGHKTYIEAYLQKFPDYEYSQALQYNSNDQGLHHQLPERLKHPGGYQQTSYSNLHSHLPTQ